MATGKEEMKRELAAAKRRPAEPEASAAASQRAEAVSPESEEIYRRFSELIPAGITVLNTRGTIISCNQAFYDQSGYSEEDIVGKHFTEISSLHLKDFPKFTKIFKDILQGKTPAPLEVAYQRKDGSPGWIEANASLLKTDGKNQGIMVFQKDITERITAEKALCESEEKHRAIFEQASDAIMLIDPETGAFLDFNNQACKGLGYSREELAKLYIHDIDVIESVEDIRRHGEEIRKKGIDTFETKQRKKNGELRDVAIRAKSIDIGGKKYGIAIWQDITERKRAEEKLNLNTGHLQDLLALHKMECESEKEILDYTIEASLRSLKSQFSFIGLMNEDESVMIIHSWSKNVTKQCAIEEKPIYFPVAQAGLWGEVVRQRRPITVDDYDTSTEFKKGYPEGHVPIKSFLGVPIFSGNKIVAVGAVANKESPYDQADINVLTSLLHETWNLIERKRAESTLRENEDKYRSIFEQSADSIVIADMETRKIIDCNDSACRNLGYTREEFAKLTIPDIDAIETPEEAIRRTEQAIRDGLVVFETIHRTKSGEIRDVRISNQVFSLGGKMLSVSVWRDITESKLAEEKYRTIVETALDGFNLADLNGRWLEVNDSYCRMTGYSREEMLNMSILDIEAAESPEEISRHLKEIIKRGYDRFESKYRRKDGSIIDVEISVNYMDKEGGRFIAFAHDITNRKLAEAALRESEEKYRAIFEQALNSIALIDTDTGEILDFNDTACRNLGYTREEFAKLKLSDIALPTGSIEKHRETVRQRGMDAFESQHRTKTGEIRDVYVFAKNIEIGDRSVIINIWHDITERRQAEEQALEAETLKEVDRLRNQLLANVSHELRTPLASIKGFATMFLEYDKKLKRHEKREYMETINRNVDRLTDFVDQLLDMTRLDAGALPIDKKQTTLSRLFRDTVTEARVRTPSHRFVLDMAKRLPKISLDARRIRQVLDNCICNAVSYSPAGTEIAISVRRVNHEILVSITDQGIGIPEEDLPYVFDRMFRARRRQMPGGGVGLGLAISKGLVEAHGGRIWIESEEGQGCRCFFTIPYQVKPEKGDG